MSTQTVLLRHYGKNNMQYRPHVLAASLMLAVTSAMAQSAVANPAAVSSAKTFPLQGEYAQIETSNTRAMVGLLNGGTAADKAMVVDTLVQRPGKFQPPVLFAVSQTLFQVGKKDDAAFLFYAAQLRARMDANLSTDPSAGQAVGILSQRYGPQINQYMLQDLDKAQQLMAQVQAWDLQTPYDYDRRWISLHGMGAFLASSNPGQAAKPLMVAEDQWQAVIAKTRKDYFDGFRESLDELRASAAAKR